MKTKKFLSVLLAVLMMMSCFTVGMVAFAAEDETPAAEETAKEIKSYGVSLNEILEIVNGVGIDVNAKLNEVLAPENFFTNKMVSTIASKLFSALYGLKDSDSIPSLLTGFFTNFTPEMVAIGLDELDLTWPPLPAVEGTEEAREKLNAAGEDWSALVPFENGDMGFEDGDRDGFTVALAEMFRFGSGSIDMMLGFYGDADAIIYRHLVPVYAALGLDALSSAELVEAGEMEISPWYSSGDLVKTLTAAFAPFTAYIETASADPVNAILELLPKLAYVIDSGLLDTAVKNIVKDPNVLYGMAASLADKIDLSSAGLYNILMDKEISGLKIGDLVTEDQFVALIADIASCGTTEVGKDADGNDVVIVTADTQKEVDVVLNFAVENSNVVEDILEVAGLGQAKGLVSFALKILDKAPQLFGVLLTIVRFVLIIRRVFSFFASLIK